MPRTRAYCTVFDRNYAPRGLALLRSLERHGGDFLFFAICMDGESKALLERLDAPQLVAVGIDEVEAWDRGLASVRSTRSAVEYCWTAVPTVCRYVLEREPSIDSITYLDADVYVAASPQPLFDELGEDSILVVPHRALDRRDEVATGRYNVGWVTVRRDANGIAALDWWRERCLEWCYARVEPGRFGDQKYLDEWPARFAGVKVCTNRSAGLGPWNQTAHRIDAGADGSLTVDGEPLVFFHYSGLTLHSAQGALSAVARRSGAYRLTGPFVWTISARHRPRLLDLVWAPYVERCAAARAELIAAGAPPAVGLEPLTLRGLASTIAREWAPTPLRDAHLGVYRRVRARRAAVQPPGSGSALPRG
jgi:hypothetical protein